MKPIDLEKRVERVLAGDIRTAARLMRQVEDDPTGAQPVLAALYPHTGRAHVVGVTGNPGSGKSTLVSKLVTRLRQFDRRVGVVAVDPSSPFSGGAILGDRIRMNDHAADPKVFIRSCSTRGTLGGVSHATEDIARVMDAMGCRVILVETVGVGQAEVEIARLAETVIVVVTPGYGDDIQAMKAGVLEIADVFVVNKSDQPGADAVVRQLGALWDLGPKSDESTWQPPVLRTNAVAGEGIDELGLAIEDHGAIAKVDQGVGSRARCRLEHMLLRLVRDELTRELLETELTAARLGPLLDALERRERDPYSVARSIVDTLLRRGSESRDEEAAGS